MPDIAQKYALKLFSAANSNSLLSPNRAIYTDVHYNKSLSRKRFALSHSPLPIRQKLTTDNWKLTTSPLCSLFENLKSRARHK
jgi:hypothetical protein